MKWPMRSGGRGAAALLLAAVVASPWPAAQGAELAPYFQSWGGESLVSARRSGLLESAILGFGVTQGRCALDPRFLRRLAEARTFSEEGGRLTLSMGGADGTYVEIACSDEEMLEMLESVLRRAGTTRLDWDLEGRQLADEAGNARRSRVLAILQARHPDLHTTFTLTGHLNGLTPDSLHVLRSTLGAGVRIDRVSVMTMTFGAGNVRQLSPATMAQAAITSFLAAADQLALLFPERDRAQLHAMMGITPMLGANDDDTVFTLADAQALAAFVRASGIGWVSYWSFQRDRAQKTHGYKPLGDYSGVAQAAGQFHRILSGAAQP